MRHGPRSLVIATLLAAATVGCDHRPEDFSRIEASKEAFVSGWNRKVAELETRQAGLFERVRALPADSPGIADVLSRLGALKVEIDLARKKLESVDQLASAKVEERRRRLAEEALATGERDLQTELSAISARLDASAAEVEALEQEIGERAAAAAPKPPPQLDDPEFARGTHRADVPGIAFKGGQLDFGVPTTKTALERIRAVAERCPEVRLGLTGHTSKLGDAKVNAQLSDGRAHQVRKYLIQSGVAEDKIVQITGAAGTQPLLPEPEPGSPEEGAMRAEELARIRAVNERISVNVVTPCP